MVTRIFMWIIGGVLFFLSAFVMADQVVLKCESEASHGGQQRPFCAPEIYGVGTDFALAWEDAEKACGKSTVSGTCTITSCVQVNSVSDIFSGNCSCVHGNYSICSTENKSGNIIGKNMASILQGAKDQCRKIGLNVLLGNCVYSSEFEEGDNYTFGDE